MAAMTEAEAKTKVCPYSFSVREQRAPDGTGIREGGPWPCLGSGCMAWRPSAYEMERADIAQEPPGPEWAHYSGTFGEPDYWGRWVPSAKGYCGLAGEPQP